MARFLIRYIDSRGVTHRNQVRARDQDQIELSMESRGFSLLSCTEIPEDSPVPGEAASSPQADTVLVVRSPDGSFHRMRCSQNDVEYLDGRFGEFGYTIVQTAPIGEGDVGLEHARGMLQKIETGMLGTKDIPAFDFNASSPTQSMKPAASPAASPPKGSRTDPMLRRQSTSASPSESAGIDVTALAEDDDTLDENSEEPSGSVVKDDANFLSHAEKSGEFISELTVSSPGESGISQALEVAPVIGKGGVQGGSSDPNNQSQSGKVDIFSLFDDIPESVNAYSSRSLEDEKKGGKTSKKQEVFDEHSKSPRLRLAAQKIRLRKIPVDPDFPTVQGKTSGGVAIELVHTLLVSPDVYWKSVLELLYQKRLFFLDFLRFITFIGLLLQGFVGSLDDGIAFGWGLAPATLTVPVLRPLIRSLLPAFPEFLMIAVDGAVGLMVMTFVLWLLMRMRSDKVPLFLLFKVLGLVRFAVVLPGTLLLLVVMKFHISNSGFIAFLVGCVGTLPLLMVLSSMGVRKHESIANVLLPGLVAWCVAVATMAKVPETTFDDTEEYQTLKTLSLKISRQTGYTLIPHDVKPKDLTVLDRAEILLNEGIDRITLISIVQALQEALADNDFNQIRTATDSLNDLLSFIQLDDSATKAELPYKQLVSKALTWSDHREQLAKIFAHLMEAAKYRNQLLLVHSYKRFLEFLGEIESEVTEHINIDFEGTIKGPKSGVEGKPLDFEFVTKNVKNTQGDTFMQWDLDYDAEEGFVVNEEKRFENRLTHTWYDNGNYTIAARIRDDEHSISLPILFLVTIENVAPEISLQKTSYEVKEGEVVTMFHRVFDPASSLDRYWIEYDFDYTGRTFHSDLFIPAAAALEYYPTRDGSFTVGMRAYDEDGGIGRPVVVRIRVENVAPTVEIPNQGPFVEGQPVVLRVNAFDPSFGDEELTFLWDVDYNGRRFEPDRVLKKDQTLEWEFANDGNFTFAVQVKDPQKAESEIAKRRFVVANAPPTITLVPANEIHVQPEKKILLKAICKDPGKRDTISAYQWDVNFDGIDFDADHEGIQLNRLTIETPPAGDFNVAARCVDDSGAVSKPAFTRVVVTNE